MDQFLFIFTALIFGLGILFKTGIDRLSWFFVGFLFCSSNIIIVNSPNISVHRFLVYCLLLSEVIRFNDFLQSWRSFPIKKFLIFFALSLFAVGVLDQRLSPFLKLYRPFYNILESYFVIFLCYASIKSEADLKKLVKTLLISVFLMTLFGLFNYLSKLNPYDELVSNAFNINSAFNSYNNRIGDRFRINSFTAHPITYGFVTSVLLLFFTGIILGGRFRNKKYAIAGVILLLINLFMTNSRSPMVAFIAGLLLLVVLGYNIDKKIRILFISILFGFMAYLTVPYIQDKVNSVIDIATTGGQNEKGSSMEMRGEQLFASFIYFNQRPITGNGFGYIQEDLGWGNSEDRTYDEELRGFESYFFVLLIEQGLFGILSNITILLGLLFYFIKNRKTSKLLTSLGISITVMFVVFALATGTLGSWMISMTFIGVIIKIIEIKRKKIYVYQKQLSNNNSRL